MVQNLSTCGRPVHATRADPNSRRAGASRLPSPVPRGKPAGASYPGASALPAPHCGSEGLEAPRPSRHTRRVRQGRGARSFLSPFTSRTPGNAERGARRRRRTSVRPARYRPILSVHANEAPYRAVAPPPAVRAVVTHSWGPRAAAARLRGARSHRLLSAPGLPLPFTIDPVGIFFLSKLDL